MGRLTLGSWRRFRRLMTSWGLPIFVSWLCIFGVHTFASANTPPSTDELFSYLENNQLDLGVESVEGYQQIYYLYEDKRTFITGAPYSHVNPASDGSSVAWQGLRGGSSQIYLYNILSNTNIQLTAVGTHQNPYVKDNIVVWETWTKDHWEISYFDGYLIHRLKDNQLPSIRPITDGKKIIFAEQQKDDWAVVEFDLETKKYETLKEGDEVSTAFPKFSKDKKFTTDAKSSY